MSSYRQSCDHIGSMAASLLLSALILLALSVLVTAVQAQQRPTIDFAADRFGYQLSSGAQCQVQWVDSSGGQTLVLQPASAEVAASDDGGAFLTLPWAFEYYQQLAAQLVVSSNGYVSFADSLQADNGGDFSNDCSLPAVPDNNATAAGRIMIWHDDLRADNGSLTAAEFADCPRPGRLPGDACSVISWQNWGVLDGVADGVDFQLLLYRRARDVVMQYGSVLPDSSSATIGMQQQQLLTAVNAACNVAVAVTPGAALCLQHPLPPQTLFRDGMETGLLAARPEL